MYVCLAAEASFELEPPPVKILFSLALSDIQLTQGSAPINPVTLSGPGGSSTDFNQDGQLRFNFNRHIKGVGAAGTAPTPVLPLARSALGPNTTLFS